MDEELHQLCKEVYKRTGWETGEWTNNSGDYVSHASDLIEAGVHFPLYTSDYLLEKLPNGQRVVKVDEAYYVANNVQGLTDVNADGKSALVALLKFTLFLNKEGLL